MTRKVPWGGLGRSCHQVNCVGGQALGEDLGPGVGTDGRELELSVVGVHRVDLVSRWGAQHLHSDTRLGYIITSM